MAKSDVASRIISPPIGHTFESPFGWKAGQFEAGKGAVQEFVIVGYLMLFVHIVELYMLYNVVYYCNTPIHLIDHDCNHITTLAVEAPDTVQDSGQIPPPFAAAVQQTYG